MIVAVVVVAILPILSLLVSANNNQKLHNYFHYCTIKMMENNKQRSKRGNNKQTWVNTKVQVDTDTYYSYNNHSPMLCSLIIMILCTILITSIKKPACNKITK